MRWLGWLLVLCLSYTLFNGAARKWILPGTALSNYLLAGQIFIPWLFYVLAPGSKRRFFPLLLGFTGVLVLLAANPINQSVYHGLFGILLHLGFFLIMFHYLENRELYPWKSLQGFLLLTFILEIALSFVQYSLPKTHEINRYAAEVRHVAFVGDAARVTGTFSFVSGYNAWLFFVGCWIWGLAVKRQASALWVFCFLGISVVASLISGSRASLAVSLVFGWFTVARVLTGSGNPKPYLALFFIAFAGLILFQQQPFIQTAWSNFYSRIEDGFTNQEYDSRTIGVVGEVVNFKGDYPVFGTGLGGTYQGARQVWGESYFVEAYGGFEEEPERIVIEGGFLLFALRTAMLLYLFSLFKIPRLPQLFILLYLLFLTHIVFNIYNIIFYGFGLAFLDWCYAARSAEPRSAM